MNADTDGVCFQIALADDEHRVHFGLFGALDLAVDLVGARRVRRGHAGAEFAHNLASVKRFSFIANGQHAHLFGSKPEREIAGVMLDQEADEAFVSPERRAMDAERRLLGIVAVFVNQTETLRHGEVHLVRGDTEFAADRAPDLHVNLGPVKCRFVRHFDKIDAGVFRTSRTMSSVFFHSSGSLTNFLAELGRVVRAEKRI